MHGGLAMSQPHLRALEDALSRRGWRVVASHPGNDYEIAATWEIRRSSSEPSLFIDFDGMGPNGDICLPLETSYGCNIRGSTIGLYFRRVNKSRPLWEQELAEFVRTLDSDVDPKGDG
jgi:hypothetical protein